MPKFSRRPICDHRILCLLAALVALLGGSNEASAQSTLLKKQYDKKNNVWIEIESIFSSPGAMGGGYLPVRVTIRNGEPIDRVWRVSFNVESQFVGQLGSDSSFRLSVDAGQEVTHDLLLPLPPKSATFGYGRNSIRTRVTTPGKPSADEYVSNQTHSEWKAIGISKTLANRNTGDLDEATEKHLSSASRGYGDTNFGYRYEAESLPSDWRGYSGLDHLMINWDEWSALQPGQKRAVRAWIHQGGDLWIYKKKGDASTTLKSLGFSEAEFSGNDGEEKAQDPNRMKIGFGSVNLRTWDGTNLPAAQVVKLFSKGEAKAKAWSENFEDHWELQTKFPLKNFNPMLVVLLLIVFGILVGPVNLFAWAKAGQRQRMFVTTPIISVVASLLILALILFGDGLGGTGHRIAFVNLQTAGEDKRAFITQEQVSRAGVLLGSGFELEDGAWITPVLTRRSQWNRLNRDSVTNRFNLTGNEYSGDWFQSRAEQGQYMQLARPTRSRVELLSPSVGGESPKLFSSLEYPVDRLIYFGENGVVWDSQGKVTPGSEIKLAQRGEKAAKEVKKWWETEATEPFSTTHRAKIRSQWGKPGHFVAVTSDPSAGLVETLESIRWKDDQVVIAGPVDATQNAATN